MEQECIPVGCVLPALYRTGVGLHDRDPPGQRPPVDKDPPPRDTSVWTETLCGQTNTC